MNLTNEEEVFLNDAEKALDLEDEYDEMTWGSKEVIKKLIELVKKLK